VHAFSGDCLLNGSPFILSVRCLSCDVCNVGVLWPNGWMDQDAIWKGDRPRPRRHCVRLGPAHPPKRGTVPPLFGPCLFTAKRLDGSRCHFTRMEICFGPGYIVLDGDPAPPKKGHSIPHFSVHVNCGQTAVI